MRRRHVHERIGILFFEGGHVRVADKDGLLALQYERHGFGDGDAVGIEKNYEVVLEILALREGFVEVHYRELAGIGDGVDLAEVRVAELVEQCTVLLALLRVRLRAARENLGEILVDQLYLSARPCMGAGMHNLVADGARILQVLAQALAAVLLHLFQQRRELQVRTDTAPVGLPLRNLRGPLVQAQAFERSLESEFLREESGCRQQVLDALVEFGELREQHLQLVPVLEHGEHQVEVLVVLEVFAERVQVGNLRVQGHPVGLLVEPVLAEQVVAENGRVLVGALVVLQFDKRVDEVQQVRVRRDILRVLEHFQQALPGIAVTVGESLERGLEAVFEFVAEREDVLVDGVVGIDVRGLPVVAHPAVAGFGERTERVLVGIPAGGLQVPVLEFGSVRAEVLADERDDFGEQRQVDACREEAFLFEEIYQRGERLDLFFGTIEGVGDFLLLFGR